METVASGLKSIPKMIPFFGQTSLATGRNIYLPPRQRVPAAVRAHEGLAKTQEFFILLGDLFYWFFISFVFFWFFAVLDFWFWVLEFLVKY